MEKGEGPLLVRGGGDSFFILGWFIYPAPSEINTTNPMEGYTPSEMGSTIFRSMAQKPLIHNFTSPVPVERIIESRSIPTRRVTLLLFGKKTPQHHEFPKHVKSFKESQLGEQIDWPLEEEKEELEPSLRPSNGHNPIKIPPHLFGPP